MRPVVYQASGRIPAITGLAFACACACAAQGAFLYAWLSVADRWWLTPFMTWIFALWLACVVRAAASLAKVRNPALMRQFGLIVGLSGWLAQWVFWIVFGTYDSVQSMPGQSMATAVAGLFAQLEALHHGFAAASAAVGWSNNLDDRFIRAMSWLAEFCILLVLPAQAGFVQAGKPFCEVTKLWSTVTLLPQEFAGATLLRARQHLAANPEGLLAALTPLGAPGKCYANVSLYEGKFDTFISVEVIELWSDEGKSQQRHHQIVEYLGVPARAVAHFKRRLTQA